MQGQTFDSILIVIAAAAVGVLVQALVFWLLRHAFRRHTIAEKLLQRTRNVAPSATALVGVLLASPALHFGLRATAFLHELVTVVSIAVIAWALIVLTHAAEDIVQARYEVSTADNLHARRIQTRTAVLRRVVTVIILVLTTSSALMTFPAVRALGASLLASAGLIGLVAGIAAQPVLSNLIAGLQIALTEPIRIDDIVVVNGDWGTIEEIAATFVVVRIWDLRRLILPLSYFLQNPIENWTYRDAEILGYAYVYADYRVSVDAMRTELKRILEQSPDWDKKTWNLQVTSLDERAVQMRALFSAQDSTHRWNLIVQVQEQLIAFLRETYPEYLPMTRVEVRPHPSAPEASSK